MKKKNGNPIKEMNPCYERVGGTVNSVEMANYNKLGKRRKSKI